MKTSLTTITIIVALVASAARATAGQSPGYGHTGWVDAGKRECCNESIALAQATISCR